MLTHRRKSAALFMTAGVLLALLQLSAPSVASAQGACVAPAPAATTAQQTGFGLSTDGCYATQLDHSATGSGTTMTTVTTVTNAATISSNVTSVLFTGGTAPSDCEYLSSAGGGRFRFLTADGFARRANLNINNTVSVTITCIVEGCGTVTSQVGVETRPLGATAADPLPPGFVPPNLMSSVTLDDCPVVSASSSPGQDRLVGLTMSASTESAPIGSSVTWTVIAENLGPTHLTGVTISDPLPPGLAVVEPLPAGIAYEPATRTVSAAIGELGIGATAAMSFDTTVQALTQVANVSSVTTDQGTSTTAAATLFGTAAAANGPTPVAAVPVVATTPGLAVTGAETDAAVNIAIALIGTGALAHAISRRARRATGS